MVKLFLFLLTCSIWFVRSDTSTRNVESAIFQYQSITSFFECQIVSVYFNGAQKLHIPLPDIPPEPITQENVSFLIYSRQHLQPYEVNTYDPKKSISSIPIDNKKRTVLYFHGLQITYKHFVSTFTDSLLPKEDINLIFVNWDSYSFYNDIYTRNNTIPRLGNILAKFLQQYIANGANPKHIYLIGVSSGAQAIGLGAKQIHPRIGRILGIDPIGTCYNFLPPDTRLTSEDADFVEIVHCSTGKRGELLSFTGDVTFYMNGGIIQPQCEKEGSLKKINDCSHESCGPYVYKTLIDFNKYIGVKCDTYSKYIKGQCNCADTEEMGYNTSTQARGTYYVNTKPLPSLCP